MASSMAGDMALFVPLMLLFGFLTVYVRKGEHFDAWLSLVLVAAALPTFYAMLRRQREQLVPVLVMLVLGFCVWAFAGNVGVRVHAGPVWWGGSVVLAVVWAAVVLSALTVAVGTAARYARGRLFVWLMASLIVFLAGMVITPALFALGVTSYAGSGLYYGIPLVQQEVWLLSGLLAGGVGALVYEPDAVLPPAALQGGMYVLAFATGVMTGEHFWIPALLGLLMVQNSFQLKNTL